MRRRFKALTQMFRRSGSLALCAALLLGSVPAYAVDDGVKPTYDEAYYAMTDYYGNLTDGSVVKSYTTNGADTLTDYGEYDEIVNLTDGLAPRTSGGKSVFQFESGAAPSHFYFEGKTAKPFEQLPWTLSVHYTLNGVPAKAEELAGKTGVVEIIVDAIPNEGASEYARYNYTLEAMAIFNQDDILSLEAPGAQVQLIGNLRAVLFIGLPGEECHFTIRVGSDDFSFGGMTFLMVPATLSQLSEISKLSERKDELEDDYDKISSSLDTMLNALSGLSGSLYATANGVEQLSRAQGTYVDGKGSIREDVTVLRDDLSNLADVLDPVEEQIAELSRTITESKALLKRMSSAASNLRAELVDLEEALEELEDGTGDVEDVLRAAGALESSLNTLQSALGTAAGKKLDTGLKGDEGTQFKLKMSLVKTLHSAYEAADAGNQQGFLAAMAQAAAAAGATVTPELTASLATLYAGMQQLKAAGTPMPFKTFCQTVFTTLGREDAAKLAEQADNLWTIYSAGDTSGTAVTSLDDGAIEATDSAVHSDEAPADAAETSNDSGDSMLADSTDAGNEENGTAAEAAAAEETKANDAVVDLITDGLNGASSKINEMQNQLNAAIESLAKPTGNVVRDLADLCGEVEDLLPMLDDAENLSEALRGASEELRTILKSAEDLQKLLDDYEPALQETLQTVNALSTNAAATIRTTQSLVADTQDLLIAMGDDLDAGTKKTLEGLSASLRAAARSLSTVPDMKEAKSSISSIIEDTWDEYTGDINNLLMMDAEAEAVSLTDERNGAPQSIQVLIRTQEIKADDGGDADIEVEQAAKTTFWGRVAQMLHDFWAALTGIFKGKE